MYVVHIQERIDRITDFTAGGRAAFEQSLMMQDAVLRNFEVIGEAVKQPSSELKVRYPQVDWRKVAGLRDVLIHNYIGVDLDLLWNIIQNELPRLKRTTDAMRMELENG